MAVQLTPAERALLISRAKNPAGPAEKARQDRAERMVKAAIDAHAPFAGLDITVAAKGSYPNNTNVPGDSDVDIKVQLNEPYHAEFPSMVNWWQRKLMEDYTGPWTAGKFRSEVQAALRNHFGTIGTDHNVAFYIPEVAGSRPSADVVPCFRYLKYRNAQCTIYDEGSVVYARDGKEIVNWPDHQLRNGRAKNERTGRRYKFVVRVLKTVENNLAAQGVIKPLPSYFSECLVYNVPDRILLSAGTFEDAVRYSLANLKANLNFWTGYYRDMVEPNEMKKVFGENQKWNADDGRELVKAAQHYLNFG